MTFTLSFSEAEKIIREKFNVGREVIIVIEDPEKVNSAAPISTLKPIALIVAQQIETLKADGGFISAIKHLRKENGTSLKEAKDIIENWSKSRKYIDAKGKLPFTYQEVLDFVNS